MDTSHIPAEPLREPMPRWANDIIRQQRARIERLEAEVKRLRGELWALGNAEELSEVAERVTAALARKEG